MKAYLPQLKLAFLAVSALSVFATAACSSVQADGMVEEPPGVSSGKNAKTIGRTAPNPPLAVGTPTRQSAGKPRASAASRKGNTTPLSPFDLARYQYCGRDSDCVTVINGCCDCANGGQEVAINKDRVAAFEANFDCLNVACGDEILDAVCLEGVVSCVDHRCKLYGPNDFEK